MKFKTIQLAFPRFQLGVLLLNSSVVFLIESESDHFHRCRHVLSSCNRETGKGHILLDLLQNMCLLLGADMCWIYCCTYTTDVDLIKILLLCPFCQFSYFPRSHYGY